MSTAPTQHNADAEHAVLATVAAVPGAYDQIADRVANRDFYLEGHRAIWSAMSTVGDRGDDQDILLITATMDAAGTLEAAGGIAEVSGILDGVPRAGNVFEYVKILHERTAAREFTDALNTGLVEVAAADDIHTTIDAHEQRLFSIRTRSTGDFESYDALLPGILEGIEERAKNPGMQIGIPSGFVGLDQMTGGFMPGDLIVIAGRPSMGKTSLMLNIADNVAIDHGTPVGIFSLEMTKEQLMFRLISARADVPTHLMRTGYCSLDSVMHAAHELTGNRILIDDSAASTIPAIRAKARRMRSAHGAGLIIVDYLQLMRGDAGKYGNREREVADLSAGLKMLAKELQVPVIVGSQLNRGVESRQDKRPNLADLRESGAIEQDADLVAMLYRDEFYNPDKPDNAGGAELLIRKHRSGPTGDVPLTFHKGCTRFENPAAIGGAV